MSGLMKFFRPNWCSDIIKLIRIITKACSISDNESRFSLRFRWPSCLTAYILEPTFNMMIMPSAFFIDFLGLFPIRYKKDSQRPKCAASELSLLSNTANWK